MSAYVPEKEIFLNVVVELAKKYPNNARAAAAALAAEHSYPDNAAALAILLAFIHLDNRAQTQRVLEGLRDDLETEANPYDISALLLDTDVIGVVMAWANAENNGRPIENVGTAILFFAVSYGAMKPLDVLLDDERISQQVTLADYRSITQALGVTMDAIAEKRSNKFIPSTQIDAIVETLREGGLNAVRQSVKILEQQAKATKDTDASTADDEDDERGERVTDCEKIIAYTEKQLGAYRRSLAKLKMCLQQTTSDAFEFLNQLQMEQEHQRDAASIAHDEQLKEYTARVQQHIDERDPDIDYDDKFVPGEVPELAPLSFDVEAAGTKKELEENIAEYERTPSAHKFTGLPGDRDRLNAYVTYLEYTRGHIAFANTLIDFKCKELAKYREELDDEIQRMHAHKQDNIAVQLASLDPDNYF